MFRIVFILTDAAHTAVYIRTIMALIINMHVLRTFYLHRAFGDSILGELIFILFSKLDNQ